MMRQRLLNVFWNTQTRRPRLPWRILVVFVMLALIGIGLTLIDESLRLSLITVFALISPSSLATTVARNVLFVAAQVLVYVGAVYLTGRVVDRRWFDDFGFHIDRKWWLDLGFGLTLGAGLITLIFLVEYAVGWIVITDTFRIAQENFAFWPWFAWSLVTFIAIGITEELLARGYLITNISEGLLWFKRLNATRAVLLAVLFSSLLFGLGHFTNPNASITSTIGIGIASLMLATGYILTGELAIPIGIHITWNFFQGSVYGFPVSGIDFGLSILALEQHGPPRVTGGAFGPEAGLLGIFTSALGITLIIAWEWRQTGHIAIASSLTRPSLRTQPPE